MEKINMIENDRRNGDKSMIIKIGDPSFDENNNTRLMVANRTDYGKDGGHNQSINITEIIDENDYLKEQYENLQKYKEKLKHTKKENKYLSSEVSVLNAQYFFLSKIFTEGIHELTKELLKIHEIQLDKIVQSKISYKYNMQYANNIILTLILILTLIFF